MSLTETSGFVGELESRPWNERVTNKRLCYCRGTARRATSVEILWPFFKLSYWQEALLIQRNHASTMSVEIVQNAAQMFDGLHAKTSATGEWHSRSFKVTAVATIWQAIYYFLLVLHCKYMPVLHRFRDINTYLPKIRTSRDLNYAHLGTVYHHHKTKSSRVKPCIKFDDSSFSHSREI